MIRVGLASLALGLAAASGALAASTPAPANAPRPAGYLLVHQNVSSYAVWRRAWDGDAGNRQAASLSNCSVFQNTGDPNDVMFLCAYMDQQRANAFTQSAFLKTAIQAPSRSYFIRTSAPAPTPPASEAKGTKKKK